MALIDNNLFCPIIFDCNGDFCVADCREIAESYLMALLAPHTSSFSLPVVPCISPTPVTIATKPKTRVKEWRSATWNISCQPHIWKKHRVTLQTLCLWTKKERQTHKHTCTHTHAHTNTHTYTHTHTNTHTHDFVLMRTNVNLLNRVPELDCPTFFVCENLQTVQCIL